MQDHTSFPFKTNLGFAAQFTVFNHAKITTALLDRLTHHCHFVLTGYESYRVLATTESSCVIGPGSRSASLGYQSLADNDGRAAGGLHGLPTSRFLAARTPSSKKP